MWPDNMVVIIVSILVILNLWSSFAIMLSLITDVFDSICNIKIYQNGYRRLLRLMTLIIIFIISYFLRNDLAFLVTLGGIIGTLCSLALSLPIIIYIATFWNHPIKPLSIMSKIFHIILLMICVGIGVVGAYNDFAKILSYSN